MIFDNIKQYKALVECNDTGKKLGDKSVYIFTTGMMMFYPYKLHEEYYSEVDYQATIAFIHDDVIKQLDGLEGLQLFINGAEFAKYHKDYGKMFNRMELTENSFDIIYSGEYTETPNDIFADWLYNHYNNSMTRDKILDDIEKGIITQGILNPKDLIEYVNYSKKYKPKTYDREIVYSIQLLDSSNSKILKRFNKFKNKINNTKILGVCDKELDKDVLDTIVNSTLPYVFESNINGTNVKVRVMKNILRGYVGSKVQSGLYKCIYIGGELYQNIIILRMKKFTISTTFTSFLY